MSTLNRLESFLSGPGSSMTLSRDEAAEVSRENRRLVGIAERNADLEKDIAEFRQADGYIFELCVEHYPNVSNDCPTEFEVECAFKWLKARAEKAEAALQNHCETCEIKTVFDSDRRFAEKCQAELKSERAAHLETRRALEELLRMYCLELRVRGHPCPENISTLAPMYAAARAAVSQSEQPRDYDGIIAASRSLSQAESCKKNDPVFLTERKAPRTCGDCAKNTPELCDWKREQSAHALSCQYFKPKADAGKEAE
jgi:hypothetical protein